MNILDAIRKSTELEDVLILVHQKPAVKRWSADEDVELDEADQRVINKLSSDNVASLTIMELVAVQLISVPLIYPRPLTR